MELFPEHEIAIRRVEERERQKLSFKVWLAISVTMLILTFFAGILAPIAIIAGLVTVSKGIDLYYSSPERVLSQKTVELELFWLYGDDWQNIASPTEYAFAQSRVRKRRIERGQFILHLLLALPINVGILFFFDYFRRYNEPGGTICLGIVGFWMLVLFGHAYQAFPSNAALARRERSVARQLDLELGKIHPQSKHKLKRGEQFNLGPDGELPELSDQPLDIKPKRDTDL
jgi:hypothetical protein